MVLGGRRTCDSDDFYPRVGGAGVGEQGGDDLILPLVGDGGWGMGDGAVSHHPPSPIPHPLLIAFFGTGAYQAMLAGEGGAHHCLAPEAPKIIVEDRAGALVTRVIGEQSWADVLGELGYH